jgi:outer membrane receptor protein involved in Fe transport
MNNNFIQKTTFFVGFCLILAPGFAQKTGLTGKVIDAQSNAPIPYASVRVFKSADSSLVSGGITNDNGQFSIDVPLGRFYTLVEFIGYKPFTVPSFSIEKNTQTYPLGDIKIATSAKTLDEVVVQAEKSTMELALDKKVFNVGKDLSNAGGTATDILSNIPSVSVDVEGNVKLRGSDNVRILIDGKPTGLVSFKGGAGLQQLQGSMIEKVEIITNPSARYEAEGMAGIINIVLKKQQKQGFNGSFELITGNPANYGVAANINYRHKKINFFLNYGLAYRKVPGLGNQYQEVYGMDTTFITELDRKSNITGLHNNARGGLDYYFDDKNILTAYYMLRRTDVKRITDLFYKDYINSANNLRTNTYRQQDETETEPNSEYALTYKRSFAQKGQELTADVRLLDYWERSDQTFTQNSTFANGTPNINDTKLQKSLNDEFEKQYLIQIDYTHPLSIGSQKDGKLEAGIRTSFRDMINDYVVTERNSKGEFFALPDLDNYFIYDENILAAYAILGNKKEKISYQFGLRGEITDVKTTLQQTNEVNPRNYANLFPSAHITYKLPKENALQLSFSRRIRRPLYNDLSPFSTFSDNRNFFSGNPNLDPEYSNAFELGHIKYFEKGSLTSAIYFRHTTDKIQSVRRVDNIGFATTQPENLLKEDAYGAEFTSQYTPLKWWKLDFNINFFRAITDGSNIQTNLASDTYSWFARQTSRFSLPQNIDFQVRMNYEAAQITPQGERLPIWFMDLGINKDVMKKMGTVTLNVSDVFNTRRNRSITRGENFYTNSDFQFRRRQINLTFNYRFNQSPTTKKAKSMISEDGN